MNDKDKGVKRIKPSDPKSQDQISAVPKQKDDNNHRAKNRQLSRNKKVSTSHFHVKKEKYLEVEPLGLKSVKQERYQFAENSTNQSTSHIRSSQ